MSWWEILILIVLLSYVSLIFGIRIYRFIKHKPLDECKCTPNGSSLVKWYHKTYKKDHKCNCGCQSNE